MTWKTWALHLNNVAHIHRHTPTHCASTRMHNPPPSSRSCFSASSNKHASRPPSPGSRLASCWVDMLLRPIEDDGVDICVILELQFAQDDAFKLVCFYTHGAFFRLSSSSVAVSLPKSSLLCPHCSSRRGSASTYGHKLMMERGLVAVLVTFTNQSTEKK